MNNFYTELPPSAQTAYAQTLDHVTIAALHRSVADLTGSFAKKYVTPGLGGLDNPKGLLFDQGGNLLVVGGLVAWERQNATRAAGLLETLVNADTPQVPEIVGGLVSPAKTATVGTLSVAGGGGSMTVISDLVTSLAMRPRLSADSTTTS